MFIIMYFLESIYTFMESKNGKRNILFVRLIIFYGVIVTSRSLYNEMQQQDFMK